MAHPAAITTHGHDTCPACASLVNDVRAALRALERQSAARRRPTVDVSLADLASLAPRRERLAQRYPSWAAWEIEARALLDIGVDIHGMPEIPGHEQILQAAATLSGCGDHVQPAHPRHLRVVRGDTW
jgi:hypothetical protein